MLNVDVVLGMAVALRWRINPFVPRWSLQAQEMQKRLTMSYDAYIAIELQGALELVADGWGAVQPERRYYCDGDWSPRNVAGECVDACVSSINIRKRS